MTALTDLWPIAGVRVVCGDLELRYLDDPHLVELARLGSEGIHDPDTMPFTGVWTRGTPTEVARSILTYQWSRRPTIASEKWVLELGLVRDGEVLGTQSLMADHFPVTRSAETGSWLGRAHQGQGLGTTMRLMILHLFFEGFGGRRALTTAWADNPASIAVTRRLGYTANGVDLEAREGRPVESNRYVLDRAVWDARPQALRPAVELFGVDEAREQLGIPAG